MSSFCLWHYIKGTGAILCNSGKWTVLTAKTVVFYVILVQTEAFFFCPGWAGQQCLQAERRSCSSAAVGLKTGRRKGTTKRPGGKRASEGRKGMGVGRERGEEESQWWSVDSFQHRVGLEFIRQSKWWGNNRHSSSSPCEGQTVKRTTPPHMLCPTKAFKAEHCLRVTQAFTKAYTGALRTTGCFTRQTWHHQGNNTVPVTICKTR